MYFSDSNSAEDAAVKERLGVETWFEGEIQNPSYVGLTGAVEFMQQVCILV